MDTEPDLTLSSVFHGAPVIAPIVKENLEKYGELRIEDIPIN